MAGAQRTCFTVSRRLPPRLIEARLADDAAQALANLLPLLACGEEAAVAAFDMLASASPAHRTALAAIGEDERGHDALLQGLRMALPEPAASRAVVRAARTMHVGMAHGDIATHCARIAALDGATCTILSALLRPGGPLRRDRAVAATLAFIREDEARHVAITRRIALSTGGTSAQRDGAAQTRFLLAAILGEAGNAFEALDVDADRLFGQIRRLPDGLLKA